MVHVFLDTCILRKDYFFKQPSFALILRYLKTKEDMRLYISDIVLMELKKQYEKQLGEFLDTLKKYESLQLGININLESQQEKFNRFYNYLIDNFKCIKLEYSNEFLPLLIDRAINRKKPFSENKAEFRDALIWLTYAKYAEEKELENCVLLTANTKDFSYEKNHNKLHPELEIDSNKFTVITSMNDFIEEYIKEYETATEEFKKFISKYNIDKDYILQLLNNDFYENIHHYLNKYEEPNYSTYVDENNTVHNFKYDCLQLYFYEPEISSYNYDEELYISVFVIVSYGIVIWRTDRKIDDEHGIEYQYGKNNCLTELAIDFTFSKNEKGKLSTKFNITNAYPYDVEPIEPSDYI